MNIATFLNGAIGELGHATRSRCHSCLLADATPVTIWRGSEQPRDWPPDQRRGRRRPRRGGRLRHLSALHPSRSCWRSPSLRSGSGVLRSNHPATSRRRASRSSVRPREGVSDGEHSRGKPLDASVSGSSDTRSSSRPVTAFSSASRPPLHAGNRRPTSKLIGPPSRATFEQQHPLRGDRTDAFGEPKPVQPAPAGSA